MKNMNQDFKLMNQTETKVSKRIEKILNEREPLYQDLADMTVDTTHMKTIDVVKLIIKKMDVI